MAKIIGKIKQGTVIDHIAAKKSVRVLKTLRLDKARSVVSMAMNVKSKKMKRKDILKVEGKFLSPKMLKRKIKRFAPKATVNWIKRSKVVKKVKLSQI